MVIFLANKLDRKDSSTHLDEWKLSTVAGCEFKLTDNSSLSDRKESHTDSFTLLIPFTGRYKDYDDWKSNPEGGYTIRPGDIFFTKDPGEITVNNIITKHNEMENSSFKVRSFTTVKKRLPAVSFQIKAVG